MLSNNFEVHYIHFSHRRNPNVSSSSPVCKTNVNKLCRLLAASLDRQFHDSADFANLSAASLDSSNLTQNTDENQNHTISFLIISSSTMSQVNAHRLQWKTYTMKAVTIVTIKTVISTFHVSLTSYIHRLQNKDATTFCPKLC